MESKANLSLVISRVVNREIKAPSLRKLAREFASSLQLSVFEQGNFTVVTLQDDDGEIVGLGASKRMPNDVPDVAIGYNLALIRAVEVAVSEFNASLEAHLKTKSNGTPKQAAQA